MKRCKFCGQEIDWMTNVEGKSMPMEPEPVFVIEDGGTEVFLDDMGAALIGRQARPEEERRDLPVAFARHRCPWKKGPSRRWTERGGGYGGQPSLS